MITKDDIKPGFQFERYWDGKWLRAEVIAVDRWFTVHYSVVGIPKRTSYLYHLVEMINAGDEARTMIIEFTAGLPKSEWEFFKSVPKGCCPCGIDKKVCSYHK